MADSAAAADLQPLTELDDVWRHIAPGARLDAARAAGVRLHDRLMATDPVVFYQSFDLVRVPYPTRYALRDATWVPTPLVHILNRMFVVQMRTAEGVKTLLVSPSDVDGAQATPFFARMAASARLLGERGAALLAPRLGSVEDALALVGIRPEDIDYITYDHLHTQDLRRWLGSGARPGYFPRAKLLVTRQEWESARSLAPPQRDWYCPGGLDGVGQDRVVLLDGDVLLGQGVALIRTPGHTEGNHSVAVRTPEGVMVTSENGVGPDSYAPDRSEIPGLRRYARQRGVEVVLNGNTLEGGLNQYISMVLEKSVAGPSVRNPAFPNVVSSSELSHYWLFPGIRPSFSFGPLAFGTPHRPVVHELS